MNRRVSITAAAAGVAAAILFSSAPPASAQVPAVQWTGFYFGGQVGYVGAGWTVSNLISTPGIGPFAGAGFPIGAFNASSLGAGLNIGYMHQFGQFVLGIEADGTWTDAKSTRSFVAGLLPFTMTTSLDYYYTVRGRIGFTWDRFLLYATGGWAWAHSGINIVSPGFFAGPFTTASARDHSGWTGGFGLDWMVNPKWIVGFEYKHLELGSQRYNFVFPLAPVAGSADLKVDEVTFRGKYRF